MIKKKNRVITKRTNVFFDDSARKLNLEKHKLEPKQCKCGNVILRVPHDAEYVICWECVVKKSPPPKPKIKVEKIDDGFQVGWRWMKQFVHADGRVFEKGIENTELTGKLPPTPKREPKKRQTKEERDAKKQQKLAKLYAKKQKEIKKNARKNAKNLKETKFWE